MFEPTPGRSCTTLTPAAFSASAGPMPESWSRRGEPIAPQLMITSRSAFRVSVPVPAATVTPIARPFWTSIFSVCAFRRTVRFFLPSTGFTKALDAEERSALRVESW